MTMMDCFSEKEEEEMRKWERGAILGKGGFASVFLAMGRSPLLPSLMAVKSVAVKPDDLSPASSLMWESYVLNRLHPSPHIIGFYGDHLTLEQVFDTETGHTSNCYLVNLLLEYASLGTLGDKIRESSLLGLPEPQVSQYTLSLLRGIHHIHQHNFVHCDLKPDNILLLHHQSSSSSTAIGAIPKIADFGLAKIAGEQVTVGKGRVRGTAPYMAPESVCYGEFESPCDVWALGLIVLEMLTAKPAWGHPTDASLNHLLNRIGHTEEIPVIPTSLSAEAQSFVRNCLVKDAALRWTTDMLLNHPFVTAETSSPHCKNFVRGRFHNYIGHVTSSLLFPDQCNTSRAIFTPQIMSSVTAFNTPQKKRTSVDMVEEFARGPSFISIHTDESIFTEKMRLSDEIEDVPSFISTDMTDSLASNWEADYIPFKAHKRSTDATPWIAEQHPFIRRFPINVAVF